MLREWWLSLERRPEPLTGRQWGMVVAATVITAVSRLLALARTPWDWDELLFMLSLDHFNVARHHPHPPGFPLYVLTAKVIRKFGFGDFHALQALSVLGAIAIVPAMFFLCRELRMRFSTSLSAAMLLAFFPNVWFYGGGAFSDVPSMTLMIAACALLLAGCRNPRAYLGGAVVLAISAGFRPQNLLVGFAPFAMATLFQIRRSVARVAGAIGVLVVIIGLSYLTAAFLTGWSEYRQALRIHQAYIARTDSFLSATRPPLWRVFDDFFVMPYHAPVINAILCALALIAIIRSRPYAMAALAAFGPLCIASWLMLDRFSASRFSIGYAPLIALLAADGMQWIARRAEPMASAAVIALMAAWTWPALSVVRPSIAPPVAAVDWIRNHVDAGTATIYVDSGMTPFAEWYLPEYKLRFIGESQPPPTWSPRQPGYYLREEAIWSPNAQNFSRPHGHLWQLVRRRYFDVSVRPVNEIIVFGQGWYEEESGDQPWRWMAARSVATLPPMPGNGRLTLSFYIPLDALESPPNIVIRMNGAIVDRFRASRSFVNRAITVPGRSDAPNALVIETDRVVTPAAQHINADTRTLGLRLNSIAWMPAR
ncbi:MAG TPA: hypothetical protein VER58_10185 [Thermoanaerobaculia bacterium]|nr:hypothetical protein [Thermoanaerobaculia bacterium]